MRYLMIIALFVFTNSAFATPETELQQQRIDTIKQYVRLMGRGDYQSIPKLFTKTAVVVSATGGPDSAEHFYTTLFASTMSKPQSRLINIFDGQLKNNMMTAYYNLSWADAGGALTSAKFVDLFIFQADSTKIKTVYVFSNNFHDDSFESISKKTV